MWRLVAFLGGTLALAIALSWLADRPGSLVIDWQGYVIETSVFRAIVLLTFLIGAVVLLANIALQLWRSPATIGNFFVRRRQQRGLDALSSGMIAIGAGDKALASRYALAARKSLPNEPLTHLLRAQAAQLSGDNGTSRRIYEAMLGSPDTEQLGLRGLFLEAQKEGEIEAARQFAERAVALNPKLGWPVESLLDIQCRQADWAGALETLATGRKNGVFDKTAADRKRAVLLTAQAQKLEDEDPVKAMELAREAHGLAQDLVPAAAIAARLLAARANTPKAIRVVQRTWKLAPHPDLATAYAYARQGDSPHDRLDRVRGLVETTPGDTEAAIALATAAIEARDWDQARRALAPLLESRLSQRVCTLMAKIESEEHGDAGRVREWLARAVNAPRDPAWTADGVVSASWQPVSPVTGALDAFQWRVPVEALETSDDGVIASRLEELVALGTRPGKVIASGGAPSRDADGDRPGPTSSSAPAGAVRSATARASDAEIVDTVTAPAPRAEARATTPAPVQARAERTPAAASPDTTSGSAGQTKPHATAALSEAAPRAAASAVPRAAAPVVASNTTAATASRRPAGEPKIFVSPRAPDDPGADVTDGMDERRSPLLPYRTPLKG
jgi:HemY protein